jgi:MYXO-CTERM domain-containing protein
LVIRPGDFANFADVAFLGANNSTVSLFDSFEDNGDSSNPRFSIDSVFANVKLGTLQPGDTVSYTYKLLAEGTTHGGEHGYVAFLGDPFGLDTISDNLVLSLDTTDTAPSVPEPASWALALLGIAFVGTRGRRRSASAA